MINTIATTILYAIVYATVLPIVLLVVIWFWAAIFFGAPLACMVSEALRASINNWRM
jgi:hypothetical protein